MVDYGLAVKRPFTDLSILSIGVGVYLLISVLALVPIVGWLLALVFMLVVNGFVLLCGKTIMEKKKALPEWKNFAELFILGVKGVVVGLIYLIPAFIVAVVVGGTAFLTGIATGGSFLSVLASAGLGFTLAVILFVVAGYVLPVALLMFVRHENMSDAFHFKNVFKKAFTGTYFVPWFVSMVYALAVVLVSGMLQLATLLTVVLPFVISALTSFMVAVTMMTLLGQAVAETK